jgi:succinate dehydrogenase hydrophobic anchor subunit
MTAPTPQDFTEASRWRRRPRPTFAWTAQIVTGVLLLVLLTVHMIAQHFLVPGGLRGYAQVIAWIRNPLVFTLEGQMHIVKAAALAPLLDEFFAAGHLTSR